MTETASCILSKTSNVKIYSLAKRQVLFKRFSSDVAKHTKCIDNHNNNGEDEFIFVGNVRDITEWQLFFAPVKFGLTAKVNCSLSSSIRNICHKS